MVCRIKSRPSQVSSNTIKAYIEVVALSSRKHVAEPRMSATRTIVSAIVTARLINRWDCETHVSLQIVGPTSLSSSITCLPIGI